jgi:quercetin dioxygenase-like cupin family protein
MSSTMKRERKVVVAISVAAVLGAGVLAGTQQPSVAEHEGHAHGSAEVEVLTGRSTSPDDIAAQLRLKLDGTGRTHVMNMADVDHMQLVKLTFAPGDVVDWHVHPGPVLVIVDEGVLTVTSASDCTARDYGPSEIYIEQGPGDVLRVENRIGNNDDTVIYALFFELPEDGPLTIFEDDPVC